MIVQKIRSLLHCLLKDQNVEPQRVVTDGIRACGPALKQRGLGDLDHRGRLRDNNRTENRQLSIRRRQRKARGFKRQKSTQRLLEAHAAVYNSFNIQRHQLRRRAMRTLHARPEFVWSRVVA